VKVLVNGEYNDISNYLIENQNKTELAVIFCLDSFTFGDITVPCKMEFSDEEFHLYTLLYNATTYFTNQLGDDSIGIPKHSRLAKLKQDVDNGYLSYYYKNNKTQDLKSPPKINTILEDMPSPGNRLLENADVVSVTGSFYFYIIPLVCFVTILLEMVREKSLKLRKVNNIFIIRVY
jgi:hypothetical protein